jgi:hypothetical protein
MLKWAKTKKLIKSGSRRASNFERSLALALLPTENQIFMACLDAHLYEIAVLCTKIYVATVWVGRIDLIFL